MGDRVRLACGLLRGQTGRISAVNEDGTYHLIGDWVQQTGFTRVSYGPLEPGWLEKEAGNCYDPSPCLF